MSQEAKVYKANIDNFSAALENTFVSEILFDIDSNPTFDIKNIPFNFLYCNSVVLITEKGNFKITTNMSSDGVDGLWTFPISDIDHSKKHVLIESKIKNIEVKHGIDNLPFKISLKFETKSILFYSGEIYDNYDNTLDYKINDEMILCFTDKNEAIIFEKLTKI